MVVTEMPFQDYCRASRVLYSFTCLAKRDVKRHVPVSGFLTILFKSDLMCVKFDLEK